MICIFAVNIAIPNLFYCLFYSVLCRCWGAFRESDEETPQEPVYPYPVYEGKELNELLGSSEWTSNESIL